MHIRLFFDGTVHEGVGYYGYAIEGLLPDGQLTWGCGKVPPEYFKEFLNEVVAFHAAIVALKFLKALPHSWSKEDYLTVVGSMPPLTSGTPGYVQAVQDDLHDLLKGLGTSGRCTAIPRKDNPALDYVIRAVEQSLPLAEEIVG